jgi:hypothetical protein
MSISPGMIFLSNNKKGFFPAAIRFFTSSKISHSGLGFFPFGNNPSVIEAGSLVQVVPFAKHYKLDESKQYWAYQLIKVKSTNEMNQSLNKLFYQFAGVQYGYLQLIWFMYRWINEKIFRRDVRHQKNWLSDGVICSELCWHYLNNFGGEYAELVSGFNPDTIQAQDIWNLILSRPDLFRLAEKKE